MLLSLLESLTAGESIKEVLVFLLLSLPVLVFSLSVHECAHGFVADKCGDPTARSLGRITLNPIKHLDPIGALMMFIFGFGWAKPVPVNSRFFKKPKRDMALTAAAGPIANLIVGFISVLLDAAVQIIFLRDVDSLSLSAAGGKPAVLIGLVLSILFYISAIMNTSLALFNLIPLPPFDGSRIALVFLPDKIYWGIMKYERIILMVVLGLTFVLSRFGIGFSLLSDLIIDAEYWLVSMVLGLIGLI